jgi:hypothetical protein
MLAAWLANTMRQFGLCIGGKENKFHHLPSGYFLQIYKGIFSPSFVFVSKLLLDL